MLGAGRGPAVGGRFGAGWASPSQASLSVQFSTAGWKLTAPAQGELRHFLKSGDLRVAREGTTQPLADDELRLSCDAGGLHVQAGQAVTVPEVAAGP